MPQFTVDSLKTVDGWLQGPIGHNAYPRGDATWINPPLRKIFELFANVKPVKSYPNIASIHKNVDIVFLREVTEGMQSGSVTFAGTGEFRPNDDITIGHRVITRKGSNRVARAAFEIARTRARKRVTAVHKEPIFRLACGMFAEECRTSSATSSPTKAPAWSAASASPPDCASVRTRRWPRPPMAPRRTSPARTSRTPTR